MGKLLGQTQTDKTVRQGTNKGGRLDPPGSEPRGAPQEAERGVHRYVRIAGTVYSMYRTTTHKFIGLVKWDGKDFNTCDVGELVTALRNESKNKSK